MEDQKVQTDSKIDLDLEDQDGLKDYSFRRYKPMPQSLMPSVPKLIPLVGMFDVGSDEAERSVGVYFLIAAIPGIISIFFSQGIGWIPGILAQIYLGIGLLRGQSFARDWVLAACIARVLFIPLYLLVFPGSWVNIIGGLAQSIGLLVLVSGKILPLYVFRSCFVSIGLGTVVRIISIFLH